MRILHVTPYAAEAWAYGGIPRAAGALTRTLARRGHEVTVCTTDAGEPSARLGSGVPTTPWQWYSRAQTRTIDGVVQHVFPNLSNHLAYQQQLFLPIGLASYLHRHASDFDVAHLHACRNVPGVLAARALRRAGVPYVLAPNGTAPIIERRRATKRAFDLLFGHRVLHGATRVLAVTRAEREQLRNLGVDPDAIAEVPNPVDLDEFATPVPSGRFRHRLDLTNTPLVMFLGRQTPRKRVDVLARAFAALRPADAHLIIAGNEMGAGSTLHALVRELGIDRRTHFTGLLRGRERLEALADADVVVYPSDHEVFGLVPLEALLSGSPVIVADDCGCGEVVGAIGGGLVTPLGDVDALARAIHLVLETPSVWRAAAAQAAARVRATYGHEVVTERVEELYQSLVRSSRSSVCGSESSSITSAEPQVPSPESALAPVSFVVPVHNGAAFIRETLLAIFAQADGRVMEVIVVDDGSSDDSAEMARSVAAGRPWSLRVISGPGRGAAAAVNAGVRAARFPIICQVDQDVLIGPDWLRLLTAELGDSSVGAVQGYYETDPNGSIFARVMGLDLEHRYAAVDDGETNHVCTGNTAYRADALKRVGPFDESLGYGYDNDMSYRLRQAGYHLSLCRAARSRHQWREGLIGYIIQQYGFGYGRLDVVAKHPTRVAGDSVSPAGMMAHPVLMLTALVAFLSLPLLAMTTTPLEPFVLGGTVIVAGLSLERLAAGIQAGCRSRDVAALLFAPVHLVRDVAWVAAIVTWLVRRTLGQRSRPQNSMRRRVSTPSDRVQRTQELENLARSEAEPR
ncbi:MAG: glycosyltransferase [Vicinamibacterales bacterium]